MFRDEWSMTRRNFLDFGVFDKVGEQCELVAVVSTDSGD